MIARQKELERDIEEFGCPYFFNEKCKMDIPDERFKIHCLEDFKSCEAYKLIEIIIN